MTDEQKTTHGGPGRGGGRKPTGVKRVAVTLDDETIERARALGDGNLSEGIRRAVADQLHAGFAQAKKDAARYLWMKSRAFDSFLGLEAFVALSCLDHTGSKEAFDAVIDDAMESRSSPLARSIPPTRSRRLVSNNTAEPVEFPEPIREPLKDGTPYCIASITEPGYCGKTEWRGRHFDNVWLQRGLVHLDEKSARQHAQALVKLSGGQV